MVHGICQPLTASRPATSTLDSIGPGSRWCFAAGGSQYRAQRAPHGQPAPLQDVGINLRSAHIGVPELFLHGADIRPTLEKMGGERVPQGVAARLLYDAGIPHRPTNRFLHRALVHVMPATESGAWVLANTAGREHVLPAPLGRRVILKEYQISASFHQ